MNPKYITRGTPIEAYKAEKDQTLLNKKPVKKGEWVVNQSTVLSDQDFQLRFVKAPEPATTKEFTDPLKNIEVIKENPGVKVFDHRTGLSVSCKEFYDPEDNLKAALEKLQWKQEAKFFLDMSAYLVSRGGRPRAFETAQEFSREELLELLENSSCLGAIPYLLENLHENGEVFYEYGFVAEPFMIDVLLYIAKSPDNISKAINGLLLGYEPSAIQSLLDRKTGSRDMKKSKVIFRKV